MKTQQALLTIVLLVAIQIAAYGQQITYSVLEDNPEKAYTRFVAPELGMDYNATALCIFIGANGRYGLTEKIELEGAFRYDLYNGIDEIGGTFLLEAGGYLPLTKKSKSKEVPIILSYNPYAGTTYKNGQRYNIEETKFIKVPDGQFINEVGVRGGLHYRKLGSQNVTYTNQANINLGGLYLGGQFTSKAYVKTKINDDVERIGAGFTRVFVDALILPVSEVSDMAADDGLAGDGGFGWRAGFQWYVSPHDGDYRFLGPSVFTAELGSKPLTGFNFMLSWGFALMSSR